MSERMLADGAGRSPEWTKSQTLFFWICAGSLGSGPLSEGTPPPQRVTSGFGRPGLFVLLGACFLGI